MKIRKGDFILVGAVLLLACGVLLFTSLNGKQGARVVVSVNGVEKGVYSLNKDLQVTIQGFHGGTNVLKISGGKASVIEASCPDGICVSTHEIYRNGECIVCLPNRVVVTVENGAETGLDIY